MKPFRQNVVKQRSNHLRTHIWLMMYEINPDKAQMLRVQSHGSQMLSVVRREGAWDRHSCCLRCALPLYQLTAEQTLNAIFTFHPSS